MVVASVRREIASNGSDPDLDHVFTLLSLTLEREPLRLALQALRGDDRAATGRRFVRRGRRLTSMRDMPGKQVAKRVRGRREELTRRALDRLPSPA